MNSSNKTVITIAMMVFAAVIIAAAVVLIVLDHEDALSQFLSFILSVLPVTVGIVVLSHQNDSIRSDLSEVADNTNGKLAAKFDAVHDRLDSLGERITKLHGGQ